MVSYFEGATEKQKVEKHSVPAISSGRDYINYKDSSLVRVFIDTLTVSFLLCFVLCEVFRCQQLNRHRTCAPVHSVRATHVIYLAIYQLFLPQAGSKRINLFLTFLLSTKIFQCVATGIPNRQFIIICFCLYSVFHVLYMLSDVFLVFLCFFYSFFIILTVFFLC